MYSFKNESNFLLEAVAMYKIANDTVDMANGGQFLFYGGSAIIPLDHAIGMLSLYLHYYFIVLTYLQFAIVSMDIATRMESVFVSLVIPATVVTVCTPPLLSYE